MSGNVGSAAVQDRRDRLVQEEVQAPYRPRVKPPEPTLCPDCGVVFCDGRWQWVGEPPEPEKEERCRACRRIRDRVPAGILVLSGEFLHAHREEIMNLLRNKVEEEKTQRPLKRMMGVEALEDGSLETTFTDRHLPRGVGAAIKKAYEGELEVQFTAEAGLIRAYWRR